MHKKLKAYADLLGFYLKCSWVYEHFRNQAEYDYKQLGEQYAAFGNYHYGLYTKMLGINETFAQVAAGYAQYKAGTWELSFWRTWLDDPEDNHAIRKGQTALSK